ncbi:MAG TPA: Spy/CpxP family protein refolding chaperone [Pyrinomonadaceae bacterium]|nr:Spy/CpxP family protein refolding chaperone [Pyrinomonadaceae bacterium]
MKLNISAYILLGAFALLGLTQQALSQETPQPVNGRSVQAKAVDKREAIMRELGLTDEQKAQLRDLNKARKPQIQAAQKTFRDAMKALDAAIYADVFDEYAYNLRLSDLQKAQAEMQRLRFENEVNIRKILTPTQLDSFRNLRRRFAAERKLQEANGQKVLGRPLQPRQDRKISQPLQRPVNRPAKVQ